MSGHGSLQHIHVLGIDRQAFVITGISSRLVGDHQAGNAETALAAALQLKAQHFAQITQTRLQEGLGVAFLPGRFQVGPFCERYTLETLPSMTLTRQLPSAVRMP